MKIIPYVLNWEGIVPKYHKKYCKELEITSEIKAYIQSKVLKCTLESISFDYWRGREEKLEDDPRTEEKCIMESKECVEALS